MTRWLSFARSGASLLAMAGLSLPALGAMIAAGPGPAGSLPSGDEGGFGKWLAAVPPPVIVRPPTAVIAYSPPHGSRQPASPPSAAIGRLRLSSPFGARLDPFRHTLSMHPGIDLPSPRGSPVFASADGIVSRARWTGGYGNLVMIDHDHGLQSLYGHLEQMLARPGSFVRRGELIGRVGSTGLSTGPHLHFEVRLAGVSIDPLPLLTEPFRLASSAPIGSVLANGSSGQNAGGRRLESAIGSP